MYKITRIGDLINLTRDKEYISLDLFDTIIRRRFIHSNEVHDTVSAYALSQIGHRRDRSPLELTQLRHRMTNALKSSSLHQMQEPILNVIWDRILQRDIPDATKRAETIQRIVSFEFALETANLALVDGARDLLVQLKAQGKILIAASDMYFDLKRMRQLLEKLQILDLFDHLYISAHVNLTKQTGALFQHILGDLKLSAKQILHAGDNPHSDIAMARKVGIMPVLVEQPTLLALERPAYGKRERIEEEVADLIKAHLFSVLLDAQDRNVDHIYFMGRDGCAISRFLEDWNSSLVRTFLPSPNHSDIFLNRALTCWGGVDFSGEWLTEAIGLAFWLNHGKATAQEISNILGIKEVPATLGVAELRSASDIDKVVHAYRDAGLTDSIKTSILQKRQDFYQHLGDIGFFSHKSVSFSDVGYSGTVLRDMNALFVSQSADEHPPLPNIILHLLATNDNYEVNAPRAFPFVDFSPQTVLPASFLSEDLKQSFSWLEFFFKHPTLRPILRFIETMDGLQPELIHDAAPDEPTPGDRVRKFSYARDADIALLWMMAVDFQQELIQPIIDRFKQPDLATINQMRDEVFELHAIRGSRRSIILEMPQISPLAIASVARESDYWIPGSIAASVGVAQAENSQGRRPTYWKNWLRRFARRKSRRSLPSVPGFDPAFYGTYYTDLRQLGNEEDLLRHYWQHGQSEKRLISAQELVLLLETECGPVPDDFDGSAYLKLNPDIAEICDTPEQALNHYMRAGRIEGRRYRAENDDDLVEQFDTLRISGSLQLTDQERQQWQLGTSVWTLYLNRHNIRKGPWIDEINVAEFRALHFNWCGSVKNKSECIVALLEKGLQRQPSLSLKVLFDDKYYRSQNPDLVALSAEEVYRHYLNFGSVLGIAPSEQVALRRLWGESEFPRSFDWKNYQASTPHLHGASRVDVLRSFLDTSGLERLTFVSGPDAASFVEKIATRTWRLNGCMAEAAKLYEAALELGGNAGRLHHLLGDLFSQSGDERRALDHFRQGLLDSSPDRWSYIHAARLLIEQRDYASAFAILSDGRHVWQDRAPWRRMVDHALQGLCESWLENTLRGEEVLPHLDQLDALYDRIINGLPQTYAIEPNNTHILIITSRPVDSTENRRRVAPDITICAASNVTLSDFLSTLLTHKLVIFHEVPFSAFVLQAIGLAKILNVRTIIWLGDLVSWNGYNLAEAVWSESGEQTSTLRPSNLWERALAARYCGEAVITLAGCRSCIETMAPDCEIHEITPPPFVQRGQTDRRVVLVFSHDGLLPQQISALSAAIEKAAANDATLFFLVDAVIAARLELHALTARRSVIKSDLELTDLARLISTVDAVIQFEPKTLRPYEAWREATIRGIDSLTIECDENARPSASIDELGQDIVRTALSKSAARPHYPDIMQPTPAIGRYSFSGKPRILFANVFFPPQVIGGATRVLKDNIDYLLDHHRDEFELAVFTADEQNERAGEWRLDSYRNIPVFRVATPQEINMDWRPVNPMVQARFGTVVDAFKPTLVHIHCLQRLTGSVADACRIRDLPYIVTLHDAWWISDFPFLSDEQGVRTQALRDFYQQPRLNDVNISKSVNRATFLRSMLMAAERRLAVSHKFASIYETSGIPCEVVENGTSRIMPEPRVTTSERVQLCHVGGLEHHKGAYLIEAALRNNRYDNLHYTVVDLARRPSDVTHTIWGTTPVTITGGMTSQELAQFYSRMNVLLAPSTWPESYGLVSREALAHGLWVISGDLGAMGDPVEAGHNGFIVPVNDPNGIIQALQEIDRRAERYRKSPPMTYNARSVDDQSKELANIYKDIINIIANKARLPNISNVILTS